MTGRLPPGPPLPSAVQTPLLWSDWQRYLDACHRRYGDVFTVRVAPMGTLVYLADPADLRTVFSGDPAVFRAGAANALLGPVLGSHSLLLLDEQDHQRSRRLMLPPLHREAVREQSELMADIAAAEIASWPARRPIALHPRMRAITLEVILRAVIGTRNAARLAELRRALPALVDISGVKMAVLLAQSMRPQLEGRWPWRRYRARKDHADELLDAEIAATRVDPQLATRTDVLAMLVAARDADGAALSDAELRDQLTTLLLAGHETTATGLAWTFERLVRHPEALRRAEVAAAADDDSYLDAVVKESLRVRPVLFDVARQLAAPVEVAGYALPAGVFVMPGIGLVQRSGRHFADPLEFRPERFLAGRTEPNTWLPFGGGARRCLGATFASVEMRIVLREVLRRVELAADRDAPERPRVRHVTLVPHRGASVTVGARRARCGPSVSPRT